MTETSGLWSTDGTTPEGDQVTSYDQSLWSHIAKTLAGASYFEGVIPGWGSPLVVTVSGANTVTVNTGLAIVDGKWYYNSVPLSVTIPTPAVNTRVDRIVLRCCWDGTPGPIYTVRITRIAGTEGAGAPAKLYTTPLDTYELDLATVSITIGGTITVTDAREWAVVKLDESSLTHEAGVLRVMGGGITNTKLAPLSVTNSKIGLGAVHLTNMGEDSVDSDQYVNGSIDHAHMNSNSIDSEQYIDNSIDYEHLSAGACKVTNRQGGSATEWNDSGSTDYVPTSARIQCGSIFSSASGNVSVTYPVAFSYSPILFLHIMSANPSECHYFKRPGDSATGFSFSIYNAANSRVALNVVWLAIGPV